MISYMHVRRAMGVAVFIGFLSILFFFHKHTVHTPVVETAFFLPETFVESDRSTHQSSLTGANGGSLDSEVGADEVANKNATTLFYSRTQTAAASTAGEFDDLVTWISPYVLYNAMIQAGQLH